MDTTGRPKYQRAKMSFVGERKKLDPRFGDVVELLGMVSFGAKIKGVMVQDQVNAGGLE